MESKMMLSHGMDKPCHHLKVGHFRWEILQGMNKLTFEERARKPVCLLYIEWARKRTWGMGLDTWLEDRSHTLCKTWEKVRFYSSVMGIHR